MSYQTEHKRKFEDLKVALDTKSRSHFKARANGGNTILFAFPPTEEALYIQKAKERFPDAAFIDVSELFVAYIDEIGWQDFKEFYKDFAKSPHLVFKSDDEEEDLFDKILIEIQTACEADKIPFLIRTGGLFGTGIENVNIMEHKMIMNQRLPLVVFYPSKLDGENLYFLNFKPASRYRCNLID